MKSYLIITEDGKRLIENSNSVSQLMFRYPKATTCKPLFKQLKKEVIK